MKAFVTAAFVACVTLIGAPVKAELIAWDDLIDKDAQDYEDPYLDLAYEQIDDLRTIALESQRLADSALSDEERARSGTRLQDARARLEAEGHDPEWLIDQRWVVAARREKAATAANPLVDGKLVTLGGFAIPAPPGANGSNIIYLVPERGMCSHMPPPDANQMVRVRLGRDWTPDMMHQPVKLTGLLSLEPSDHEFIIVDGPVRMRASLTMEAHDVQTLGNFSSRRPKPAASFHRSTN